MLKRRVHKVGLRTFEVSAGRSIEVERRVRQWPKDTREGHERRLRSWFRDHGLMIWLRRAHHRLHGVQPVAETHDEQILASLAAQVRTGAHVSTGKQAEALDIGVVEAPLDLVESVTSVTPPPEETETHWVEFLLIDPKKNPLADIDYCLIDPAKEREDGTTGKDGKIRKDGIEDGTWILALKEVEAVAWSGASVVPDETVSIEATVSGYDDGTAAEVKIYPEYAESEGSELETISGEVKNGKVAVEWTYAPASDGEEVASRTSRNLVAEVVVDGKAWAKSEAIVAEVKNVMQATWESPEQEPGEPVAFSAKVSGYVDGTPATVEIWQEHPDRDDELLETLSDLTVQDKAVTGEWTVPPLDGGSEDSDADDGSAAPVESDREYYFKVIVDGQDAKAVGSAALVARAPEVVVATPSSTASSSTETSSTTETTKEDEGSLRGFEMFCSHGRSMSESGELAVVPDATGDSITLKGIVAGSVDGPTWTIGGLWNSTETGVQTSFSAKMWNTAPGWNEDAQPEVYDVKVEGAGSRYAGRVVSYPNTKYEYSINGETLESCRAFKDRVVKYFQKWLPGFEADFLAGKGAVEGLWTECKSDHRAYYQWRVSGGFDPLLEVGARFPIGPAAGIPAALKQYGDAYLYVGLKGSSKLVVEGGRSGPDELDVGVTLEGTIYGAVGGELFLMSRDVLRFQAEGKTGIKMSGGWASSTKRPVIEIMPSWLGIKATCKIKLAFFEHDEELSLVDPCDLWDRPREIDLSLSNRDVA